PSFHWIRTKSAGGNHRTGRKVSARCRRTSRANKQRTRRPVQVTSVDRRRALSRRTRLAERRTEATAHLAAGVQRSSYQAEPGPQQNPFGCGQKVRRPSRKHFRRFDFREDKEPRPDGYEGCRKHPARTDQEDIRTAGRRDLRQPGKARFSEWRRGRAGWWSRPNHHLNATYERHGASREYSSGFGWSGKPCSRRRVSGFTFWRNRWNGRVWKFFWEYKSVRSVFRTRRSRRRSGFNGQRGAVFSR